MDLSVLLIIAAILNFGLGVFVWNNNKHIRTNVSFGVMACSMALWVFLNYLLQIHANIVLFKLILSVGLFIAITIFSWVNAMQFTSLPKHYPWLQYALVTIALVMIGPIFYDGAMIQEVRSPVDVVLGPYFIFYAAFLGLLLCLIIFQMINVHRISDKITRNKLRFSGIGLIIFCALVIFFDVILPLFGINNLGMLDSPSSLIFVLFTGYAIVFHRLFDIRVIIKRTVVYSVLLAFVLVTYALVVLFFSQVFGGQVTFGAQTFVPNIVAAVMIALGFDPLKRWLQAKTDKYLFKGEYDPQDLAAELAKMLSNVVNLDEALDSMMSVVTRDMRIGRVATLVIRKIEKDMVVKRIKATGFSNVIKLEDLPTGALIEYFAKSKELVLVDELKEMVSQVQVEHSPMVQVIKQLEQFEAAVALPLVVKDAIIGILMVGEKLSGDGFSRQDLDTLELIGSQTALSIEKAQFYEEDKLKSEFISIASHELLTPTAAIEGYLSMALDEKMPQTKEQQHQYLQRAYDSSRRLADLVKDLLSISRIESGRMKIVPAPLDIVAIVDQAVGELQVTAKAKGLQLTFTKPSGLPKVIGDPDRMMQVCINLINNSIKYTLKGSVDVSARLNGKMVEVSVKDTGIGISKKDQEHLFEKFHRIENASTAGIMGTGLGLYIVKNIISLLGGTVAVSSEEGKGSAFSFTLPVAK